jgi:RNA polymerase primary sigma factor
MAVMAGVESAVQLHIHRGDDLNARDTNGMTPLMLSAARDKPAICKLLLSAGADHGLLDPSGKTALEIALAAGSDATAAILDAARAPLPGFPPSEIALEPEPDSASEPSLPPDAVVEAATPSEPETPAYPPRPEPTPPSTAVTDVMDDGEFDLTGWEVEEEPTRPEADMVVVDSASAVQIAITAHEPIDSSVEWDDIDAYLPEEALPLARADDAEGRARLRRLLLRALREGSVPALDVQVQSTNEDRSANPEAETYLAMVINDLGAEVDERFEYSDCDESFEVFVNPEETPDEEAEHLMRHDLEPVLLRRQLRVRHVVEFFAQLLRCVGYVAEPFDQIGGRVEAAKIQVPGPVALSRSCVSCSHPRCRPRGSESS